MGGFMLYDDEYPIEVLDYSRLVQLLKDQAIDAPMVTERSLQDRSKGDTISKGIIVLQTTWFVLQCIARAQQRLPLSELEVITLAFAVMNAAIYATWWDKPQGVEMSIPIPLKRVKKEVGISTTPSTSEEEPYKPEDLSYSEPAGLPQSDSQSSSDNLPLIPPLDSDDHVEEMDSWFWRKISNDRRSYSLPYFLFFFLPYRIFVSVVRSLGKTINSSDFRAKTRLRMSMFYSLDEIEDNNSTTTAAGLAWVGWFVITPLFGAIHLIPWKSEFPSPHDLVLWRLSAVVITVAPLLLILTEFSVTEKMGAIGTISSILLVILTPFYIAARFAVIIIALKDLVHPSPSVLLDISWTSYIPHL